jgi:uncharacterized protein
VVTEWDEAKRQSNLLKHGLDFTDAELIFEHDVWEIEDTREDYGEERIITFGLLKGRVVILVHTPRASALRIISLRKADSDEEQLYFENVFDGLGTD